LSFSSIDEREPPPGKPGDVLVQQLAQGFAFLGEDLALSLLQAPVR